MSKSQSSKRKSAIALSENILRRGIIMIPCDSCRESSLECRMSAWSRKCGHCVRRGVKCNAVEVSSSDFSKVERERSRIESELQTTRDGVARMSASLTESLARMNRLEKQQAFLREREGEMVRRGVENIEALEKLEEEERLLKERADANTVATSEPAGANSSSASGEWVPSPSLLRDLDIAQWGFVDETVEPNVGTS